MVVTTTTTTAVGTVAVGVVLGGVVLVLLIAALIVKEVSAHSGNERLLPLHRAMNVSLVPLSVAAAFVLVQQLTGIV
jgi:hypothetical protein